MAPNEMGNVLLLYPKRRKNANRERERIPNWTDLGCVRLLND